MSRHDDDGLGEPGDFVWYEGDSEALRRGVIDAELLGSADGMRDFLRQIDSRLPLTAEDEAELAKRITAGRRAAKRLAEIDERGEESADPRRNVLIQTCRDGDDARHDLVQAHQRLVVALSKRYTGRGTAFLDLIQIGGVGLTRAAEKFDGTKGYRFSVYATWWIRQSITRTIAE